MAQIIYVHPFVRSESVGRRKVRFGRGQNHDGSGFGLLFGISQAHVGIVVRAWIHFVFAAKKFEQKVDEEGDGEKGEDQAESAPEAFAAAFGACGHRLEICPSREQKGEIIFIDLIG